MLAVAAFATVAAAEAAPNVDAGFYDCTVVEARLLGDDGKLSEARARKLLLEKPGNTFRVNRQTGAVSGAIDNSTFAKVTVFFTPPDNSFQVTSESHGPNKRVEFLRVRDWQEGPKKAFVYVGAGLSGDGVLSGTCVVKPR